MANPFYDDPVFQEVENKIQVHETLMNMEENAAAYLIQYRYEGNKDYEKRQSLISIFNLYKKIILSVIGLASRKPPAFTIQNESDNELRQLLTDVNLHRSNLSSYLSNEVFKAAMGGFGLILVDYSRSRQRPYFRTYNASSIRHVRYSYEDGNLVFHRVVLITKSREEIPGKDFEYQEIETALVLKLEAVDGNSEESQSARERRVAKWEVWKKVTDQSEPDEPEDSGEFIDANQVPLNFLPIAPFYGEELQPGLGQPPLYPAAKKNLKHMNVESSFESGLLIANYPMLALFANGAGEMQPDADNGKEDNDYNDNPFKLSPRAFFTIPDNDARLEFIEFEGTSLELTMKAMQKLEEQVVSMGINILTDQKTQITKAQYEGESLVNTSVLEQIVSSVETAINTAYAIAARYLGRDPQNSGLSEITLNRDYIAQMAEPNFIREIRELWQDRLISGQRVVDVLVQQEVLPNGTSYESEQELIQEEMTSFMSESVDA